MDPYLAEMKKLMSRVSAPPESIPVPEPETCNYLVEMEKLMANFQTSTSLVQVIDEPIPPTQPSMAIPFEESVEVVNSQDPITLEAVSASEDSDDENFDDESSVASETSETYGLSFLAEDEEVLPSDYEACEVCGFDHEYEPAEAQMAHAEKEELWF